MKLLRIIKHGALSLNCWIFNRKSASDDNCIYQQAADKFISLHDENVEIEDWVLFQQWEKEDIQHAEVIDKLDELWCRMDQLQEIPWPTEEECRLDTYEGEQPIPVEPVTQTTIITLANVVLKPFLLLFLKGKYFCKWLTGKPWLIGWSVTGVVVTTLLAAIYIWPIMMALPSYYTGISEHRLITLQDGTEILMGAKTTVRVNYSDSLRQVYLDDGEALFTVKKDKTRPFLVTSGKANVVAVGTQFNVHRMSTDVVVSVVEGVVNVTTDPFASYQPEKAIQVITGLAKAIATNNMNQNVARLKVGEQIRLSENLINSEVEQVVSEDVLSWRDGRLTYSGDALSVVIADVSRYHDKPIRIEDSELEKLQFSGTILKGEVDDWLEGLQAVYAIKIVTKENEIIVTQK